MRAPILSVRRFAILLAVAATAFTSHLARAGLITPDNLPTITCAIEGADPATWSWNPTMDMFTPNTGPDGGYRLTTTPSWNLFDNRASMAVQELVFDPDPFVLNNILVTNTTGSTQIFTVTIGLPTSFAAPNSISGSINASVIDGANDGATLASVSPTPIYQAEVDGSAVATLLDHPFTLVAPPAGNNNIIDSFGPTVSGVPVTISIGIQLRFSLSAGDTASILSRFDVVDVPGPAALPALGLAAIRARGRRRRE